MSFFLRLDPIKWILNPPEDLFLARFFVSFRSPQLPRSKTSGKKKGRTMKPLIQLKQTTSVFLMAFGLTCFGLWPALAVSPPPDGGYPNGNTAEGDFALFSLTSGSDNTAIGFAALLTIKQFPENTAVGSRALQDGATSTAVGYEALLSNTN